MNDHEVTIVIEGGEVRFVHDDDVAAALEGLGPREVRRASSVEPFNEATGQAWMADMDPVGGPCLIGPRRSDLIKSEVEWLVENGVPFPKR